MVSTLEREPVVESAEPVILRKLKRDLKVASQTLNERQARYLVDIYYQQQRNRITAMNMFRTMLEAGEPHEMVGFVWEQQTTVESQIKSALDSWSASKPLGQWARRQKGVGPVLAAGLLSNIDLNGKNSVGQIWSFAGLNPTQVWNKGEKRPWNARLKVVCWKLGESFVKVSGAEDAFYGQLYRRRKEYEATKNANHDYADQAAQVLATKKIGKDTDAYKHYSSGFLPPAHIHARACRWTVKMFLSHYFEVGYTMLHGVKPPSAYVFAHLQHTDYIPPPD